MQRGERAALRAAGFELVVDSIETLMEDGLPHRFLLVLARQKLNYKGRLSWVELG
jgi:hypothetical protein